MNNQQFFEKCCTSIREQGNSYGSPVTRLWGWVNEDDPGERCAIARFINGNTDREVITNLKKVLNLKLDTQVFQHPVVFEITRLFDFYSCVVQNPDLLELALKQIANRLKLNYTSPIEIKKESLEVI